MKEGIQHWPSYISVRLEPFGVLNKSGLSSLHWTQKDANINQVYEFCSGYYLRKFKLFLMS
jgi:hypothetical protein